MVPRLKTLWVPGIIASCTFVTAAAVWGVKNHREAPPVVRNSDQEPKTLLVKAVRPRPLTQAVGHHRYTGRLVCPRTAEMAFRVGGKIESRLVQAGDVVRAGQLLATLDSEDLRLQLETAVASLAQAEARRVQGVAEETRYLKLVERQAIGQADYDRALADRDAAVAAEDAARQRLDLARRQLEFAALQAESDGIVLRQIADAGQVVASGQPVLEMAYGDSIAAEFFLPEDIAVRDHRSSRTTLKAWSDPDFSQPLRLSEQSAAADPISRMFRTRYELADYDTQLDAASGGYRLVADANLAADTPDRFISPTVLKLGMTVELQFENVRDTACWQLPATAIDRREGTARLWALTPIDERSSPEDDASAETSDAVPFAAEPITVQILDLQANLATVTSLEPLDRLVVATGLQKLYAGRRVQPWTARP